MPLAWSRDFVEIDASSRTCAVGSTDAPAIGASRSDNSWSRLIRGDRRRACREAAGEPSLILILRESLNQFEARIEA
jgi:hypothetical protein